MLSNYEIEKQLGKGTYGVVYKVKKRDDNKIYVLKQISLLGLTASQKDEVKLEAKFYQKLNLSMLLNIMILSKKMQN